MSRGFVKEDDQEEIPMVPPRADLPKGAINYVTPHGFVLLQTEKKTLIQEIEQLPSGNDKERRIASNFINAKLQLLNARIASAKVINFKDQHLDSVRFGAQVTVMVNGNKILETYQIVGVDEANIAARKISYVSPIARILIGKKIGDSAILQMGKEQRVFKITAIDY
ncbi:transcription elongation factor GreB [Maribacter sedimenticola]|uniref:Transcription elongation factor GreB n=1 Tax=Maribacter sedimenticola TaxID=228956 RepID=A0ABY1SHK0_9FLAO|nr:GreA/GreB family elongation factor [Maribacter sedimenticola]SNR46414.1 transcription elongation factor GreB [Maribacter sedimenticola]